MRETFPKLELNPAQVAGEIFKKKNPEALQEEDMFFVPRPPISPLAKVSGVRIG